MKRVIVTGANGFIGKKIMNYFSANGYVAQGWDVSSSEDNSVLEVNILNRKDVLEHLAAFNPELIIHCAGCADVSKSIEHPESDFEGNVILTHNLLFSLHELKMDDIGFIFLSSAGVYGNPRYLPIDEEMQLNPLSPYALHKVMCEEICVYFAKNYKMRVKIARIFSAYGSGLKKQIFWDMLNKYKKYGYIEMFGTGNESRDYIHVDDVVRALFLIANSDDNHIIYNVANGEEVKIKEVAEIFSDCLNISHDLIKFNGVVREGDPLNWKADISRIERIGYKKNIEMTEGLLDYINWGKTIS